MVGREPAEGLRTPVVFIVDDDEKSRSSLHWLLGSVGLKSRMFAEAQEFLSAVNAQDEGCIILDIRLPGLSGLEIQARLAEQRIQLPIIFLSGFATITIAVRAMKAGAFDVIEKPFEPQLLIDRVNAAVADDIRRRTELAQTAPIRKRLTLLTPREREVLLCLLDGLPNKEIAAKLKVSQRTVEIHRARVMLKFDARCFADLVRMVTIATGGKYDSVLDRPVA